MKNLNLKVISVGVAVLLALFVNSEGNTSQIGLVVPVEFKNIPEGKVVIEPRLSQAQITIRGPSFLVSQVPLSPPTIKIKFPSDVGNRFIASLGQQRIDLPPSVQIVSIEPPEVTFVLDDMLTAEYPVMVPQIGTLSDNLVLEEIVVNPTKVQVRGPASQVKKLTRLETDPIDLRDLQSDAVRTLALRPAGPLLDVRGGQVTVSVKVSPRTLTRQFEGLPIEVRSRISDGITIAPKVVNVEVSGTSEATRDLRREEVIPFVRLSHPPTINEELSIDIDLPEGIKAVAINPPVVKVASIPQKEVDKAKPAPIKK